MSTENEFVPDGNQQQESGGSLRKTLEDALKRLHERDQELETLKAEMNKKSLDAVFSELGVPEKARAFYHGEADKAAIEKWVSDNADVLRLPTQAPPEQEQQMRAVQRADNVTNDFDSLGDEAWREAAEKVAHSSPTKNPAALDEFFRAAGLGKGSLIPPQIG